MIPVIAIRPEPGCAASVAALQTKGLEACGFPLFTVEPVAWQAPDPDTIDALLIGSANAIRQGGEALADYLGKPVYAVGMATTNAARKLGFAVIGIGEGGLQSVLDQVLPGHKRLLRLAGRERVDLILPGDTEMIERTVYAATPLPMPRELEAMLRKPCVVMLHSARAARHFAGLCLAHGIDRSRISLAAIGPRVASAVGDGWAVLANAQRSDDQALLALAQELCQNPPRFDQGSQQE